MSKHIFVICETRGLGSGVEIVGYTTTEDEANRIVEEWQQFEIMKGRYALEYNWQEMALPDDCLDGIKPRERK